MSTPGRPIEGSVFGARDDFYDTVAWKAARAKAVSLSGYLCRMCNCSVRGKGRSRVDHIKTRREAPHLALMQSNLRVLCIDCDAKRHAEKGNRAVPILGTDANGWPTSPAHHWNKKT